MRDRKRVAGIGRTFGAVVRLAVLAGVPVALASCGPSEPKPTPEEQKYHDAWGALISPARRSLVEAESHRHTAWSEKKRVLWEGKEFQHIYEAESRKARTTQPSTKATSQPAAQPATLPASPASMPAASQPAVAVPVVAPASTTPPVVPAPVVPAPVVPPTVVPSPPAATQPLRGRTGHQSTTRHVLTTRPATTSTAP